ncbi:MAG: isocitrate/isopropylmalate dehydrogenase family protein [Candidatus Thermoplasmatota archaeon]|nr:isocitrate/isopropylmalate dehydrogenase family protein [Euryarchaeota archaeon]MBU4031425.1 isocitrate/isopropylmalate dehydrogenase family protein [Candidatus Thermoplasmatota archaeon]MBU4071101.1 isocitrate/isopropylmalate dehydrogenase family protein [Candidatus Thermoplasmatota archaeon]MBU4145234.1 isocitrate/isopropylmalate dehydrogenase family protein [Candidatus Thermoplasmatota archaeon]MBU4592277.1 isocitrate/isopropylmalate dehydrogenase family protein [Candidatus Thermoplasmato
MHRICVIPGDGVGPEVIASARAVLDNLDVPLRYEETVVGTPSFEKYGVYITKETLSLATESDAIFFGALTTPKRRDYVSPLLLLRWNLELYANVRPSFCLNPAFCLVPLDIVIVRENTEGLYGAAERELENNAVLTERIVSEAACQRIIDFAFDYAKKNNRGKVTCVHKANVLRTSDEMFKKLFYGTAVNYAFYNKIRSDDVLVDAAAMYMCREPGRFDVIVTLNLYGDILSDEAGGLIGGLGFCPSANIGKKNALFEPVHGSAPDIAGKDAANPTGMILSAAMMLDYLGMPEKSSLIRESVRKCFANKNNWTKDVGGECGTGEFTKRLIKIIDEKAAIS